MDTRAAQPWKPTEATELLEYIRRAHRLDGDLVLDHAIPVQGTAPDTMVLIASSAAKRYLAILEAVPGAHEAGSSDPGDFSLVLDTSVEPWMSPEAPQFVDLDGDGTPEVLFAFWTRYADRAANAILTCARRGDRWRGFPPPALISALRNASAETRGVTSIYQEDKYASLEIADQTLSMQALSNGGRWQLVARPDGRGSNLLGIGVELDAGAVLSPHRVALGMYRFTGDGFALDREWNGGRPCVTEEGQPPDQNEIERIVAEGWGA